LAAERTTRLKALKQSSEVRILEMRTEQIAKVLGDLDRCYPVSLDEGLELAKRNLQMAVSCSRMFNSKSWQKYKKLCLNRWFGMCPVNRLVIDRELRFFDFENRFGFFVTAALDLILGRGIGKDAGRASLIHGLAPVEIIPLFFAIPGGFGRDTNLIHKPRFDVPICSPFARKNGRKKAEKPSKKRRAAKEKAF
jgi:hypothetical protein